MMKFVLLFLLSFNVYAVDLREYLVDNTIYLNTASGAQQAKYTFTSSNAGLESIYNSFHYLGKAGQPFFWRKDYRKNNVWCTFTFSIMFKGDDKSVTETGDWYANSPCTPNVVLGYRNASGVNNGLIWSPAGGLTKTVSYLETNVWNQGTPGGTYTDTGTNAFSKTGLIEELETFTPKYGRLNGIWAEGNGTTYTNVIHLVMYHGTQNSTITQVRCNYSPLVGSGAYYQSFKNYNAYAIELWLAKGIGIIQERIPFVERGADLGTTDCSGHLFNANGWQYYIDN